MNTSRSIVTAVVTATTLALGACASSSGQRAPGARATQPVNFQLIRNATLKLEYAGTTFLVDPMLGDKDAYPGFANTVRSELRMPLTALPMPVEEVLDVDAIVLTHLHADHWDEAARRLVPRNIPMLVQDDEDAARVRADGFTDVRVLGSAGLEFNGTRLHPTGGQHGTDQMYALEPLRKRLGRTTGVVFERPGHATIYVAGDTTWSPPVETALERHRPDVVILNAGYAQIAGFEGSIIMGRDDVLRASQALPDAKIVAVHMEAVNHATLSRKDLRAFVDETKSGERVLIPADGERYTF